MPCLPRVSKHSNQVSTRLNKKEVLMGATGPESQVVSLIGSVSANAPVVVTGDSAGDRRRNTLISDGLG